MDDVSGQGDLHALFEARRRIVAAFEDIAAGTEALASYALAREEAVDPAEVARLLEALDEERTANAQLEERVRALRERGGSLDAVEAELGAVRGRLAELEASEAARAAEIDAVLSELIPLLEETV
jgi:hypothetical protein